MKLKKCSRCTHSGLTCSCCSTTLRCGLVIDNTYGDNRNMACSKVKKDQCRFEEV